MGLMCEMRQQEDWRDRGPHWAQRIAVRQLQGFQSQAVLDCYTSDPGMQGIRRAPVKELTCSQNLLYSLCAGFCVVWRSEVPEYVGTLNDVRDVELVVTICYNSARHDLILVSVFPEVDAYNLRTRAVDLSSEKAQADSGLGQLMESQNLFSDLTLQHPGFVDLSDEHHKALVFCSSTRHHHVYCLHTYRCLFRLHSPSLCHHLYLVSFGNEHLLVTAQTSRGCGTRAAFSMLSLEDGSCHMATELDCDLDCGAECEHGFLEVLASTNGHLILKRPHSQISTLDLRTGQEYELEGLSFSEGPVHIRTLSSRSSFITCSGSAAQQWSLKGALLQSFNMCKAASKPWHLPLYEVSKHEDFLIFLAEPECQENQKQDNTEHADSRSGRGETTDQPSAAGPGEGVGTLKVTSLGPGDPQLTLGTKHTNALSDQVSVKGSQAQDVLKGVTAMCYAEHSNQLFVGKHDGTISVWSH